VPSWAWTVIGVTAGLIVVWLALVIVLLVQQHRAGRSVDWRSVMRLVPDLVRLIKRLATDPAVPRGTRLWLVALLIYLALPIDLVPDIIPVIGFADDAIVTVIALRFAINHAGLAAVQRNWPGSADGLATVLALAGLGSSGI
jgi:uncharacterized membrane protein YkvA (DUF1232 family)